MAVRRSPTQSTSSATTHRWVSRRSGFPRTLLIPRVRLWCNPTWDKFLSPTGCPVGSGRPQVHAHNRSARNKRSSYFRSSSLVVRAVMLQNLAKCSWTRRATASLVFGSPPSTTACASRRFYATGANTDIINLLNECASPNCLLATPIASVLTFGLVGYPVLMDRCREGESIRYKKPSQDSVVFNSNRRH